MDGSDSADAGRARLPSQFRVFGLPVMRKRNSWDKTDTPPATKARKSCGSPKAQGSKFCASLKPLFPATPLFPKAIFDLFLNHRGRERRRPFSRNHDYVGSRNPLVAPTPKEFSQDPFNPVPHHGITDLCADSNSQSAHSALIARTDNNEIGRVNLPTGSR